VIEIYICTAIALVAVGVAAGVQIVVALTVHREGRELGLLQAVADRTILGTWPTVGAYTRVPQPASRGSPQDNLMV
jgi:predicted metal-dependent phosphotriesterase family hydrolase